MFDEIKARWSKITPGGWKWEDEDNLVSADPSVVGGAVLWAQDNNAYGAHIRMLDEDRDAIVNAPKDIQWLIMELESAYREIARYEAGNSD